MQTITIDNRTISSPEGHTILEVANQAGITIPALCYRSGCRAETSCLVCQVRLLDPSRPGAYKTVPSCATLAVDGMVIDSSSPEVIEARKTALELLLSDHRGDCFGPCTTICPTGLDIPSLVRAYANGQQDRALEIVFRSMAFPSVLGRLCGHPCENGCRRRVLDQAIPIQSIHKTVSDEQLLTMASQEIGNISTTVGKNPAVANTILAEKSVAVVGAGIAGLSAAFLLARAGARVVVFERTSEAGGRLRTEFAERLSGDSVLIAEIERIWAQGVDWRPNVQIDQPETLTELTCLYDAVLWAAGAESLSDLLAILPDSVSASPSVAPSVAQSTNRWKNLFWLAGNLFIAGDAKRGKKSPPVLNAGDGRWSALAITRFLQGDDLSRYEQTGLRPWGIRSNAPTKDELQSLADAAAADATGNCFTACATVAGSNGQGVCAPKECGNSAELLRQAAASCLHCDCRAVEDCRLRRWSEYFQAISERWGRSDRPLTVIPSDYGIIREPSKCIDCGLCVQIANQAVREEKSLQAETSSDLCETTNSRSGLAFRGRGFPVEIQVPFNDSLNTSMSKETARRCSEACPTAAFNLREEVSVNRNQAESQN